MGKCCKSSILKSFLNKCVFNAPTVEQKEITYPTISTLPIPVAFDEAMIAVYQDQQKSDDLNLQSQLVPEIEFCEHGHRFSNTNNTLERKVIVIYTARRFFNLLNIKVGSNRYSS